MFLCFFSLVVYVQKTKMYLRDVGIVIKVGGLEFPAFPRYGEIGLSGHFERFLGGKELVSYVCIQYC